MPAHQGGGLPRNQCARDSPDLATAERSSKPLSFRELTVISWVERRTSIPTNRNRDAEIPDSWNQYVSAVPFEPATGGTSWSFAYRLEREIPKASAAARLFPLQ